MTSIQARDPKIEILESNEDVIRFILSDTDTSVANSLRRVMIAEVATMAIEIVEFYENTTPLHDEFIAHRLGLLPLKVEKVEEKNYKHECVCADGCENCSVEFELDVSNPGPEETKTIYSTDIRAKSEDVQICKGYTQQELRDRVGGAKGIVVAMLGVGQRLHLKATAFKGIGKLHAKWSPVAVATYTFEPRVTINTKRMDELTDPQRRELEQSCPTKVYMYDESAKKVQIRDASDCIFCDQCVKVGRSFARGADDDNVVAVETVPNRFIFTVEAVGQLRPEEIVLAALHRLQEIVANVRTELDAVLGRGGLPALSPADDAKYLPYRDLGGFI
jgi:DNA-directed RNA polymerase II subunit RPB3